MANEMNWSHAVEVIMPHVFRISTPQGSGTGFMLSNGKNSSMCGIATAAHVIDHAHYWEEPVRFEHVSSGKSLVVRRQERAIFLDAERDTAAIMVKREDFPLPSDPLPLVPEKLFLKVGNEIAWLGFPAIPSASLCFFSGRVSAWLQNQRAYLVDGVAINGVSGGPAFHIRQTKDAPDQVVVVGVVSAYVPNRATGETLPGLSVVRDVSQFHELVPQFASLDEAQSAAQPSEPPSPNPETHVGETQTKRNG